MSDHCPHCLMPKYRPGQTADPQPSTTVEYQMLRWALTLIANAAAGETGAEWREQAEVWMEGAHHLLSKAKP